MQMKVCSKCGQEKPVTEFYKDKKGLYGVRGACSKCSQEVSNATRERRRESDRKYKNSEKGRKKRKEYVANNYERLLELGREAYERNHDWYLAYRKERSVRDRDIQRKRNMEYKKKYPERKRARDAVGSAIKRGEMLPATDCQCTICKKQASEYHHPSYAQSQWLVVIALCRSCHLRVHRSKAFPLPPIA